MRLIRIVAAMAVGSALAWFLGGQLASNVGLGELYLIGEVRVVIFLSMMFGFVSGLLMRDLRGRGE